MLEDSYKTFLNNAKGLPNFKAGTKNDCDDIQALANGYCEAERDSNKELMGRYLSALFVRYWYMIPYLYQESKSLRLQKEEMLDILYDAFMKAFKNKTWLNSDDKMSRDSHGAQKCIERCIDSVRLTMYQQANYDVRKINYISHSLDMVQEVYGDSSEEFLVEDTHQDTIDINTIIMNSLKNNNVLQAILVDNICYQNCLLKNGSVSFSRIISNLDVDYIKYFMRVYGTKNVNVNEFIKLLQLPKKKLMYNIKKELLNLSSDEVIKDLYALRCSESK